MFKLLRNNIKCLTPYSSARSLQQKSETLDLLDANENPFDDEFKLGPLLLNRYPDPRATNLRTTLAKMYQVAIDEICISRGSDEAIDLLIRMYCDSQDSIMTLTPSYSYYEVCANIHGITCHKISLTKQKRGLNATFTLNPQEIIEQIKDKKPKLFFLCNPNNPTGTIFNQDDILQIAHAIKDFCILVVDEAYIEFSQSESCAKEIKKFSNLIVLRTLSKAFGLAGCRVGSIITTKETIERFAASIAPYPIPSPIEIICLDWLSKITLDEKPNSNTLSCQLPHIVSMLENKDTLLKKLPSFAFVKTIFESHTNFVLFEVENAIKLYDYMKQHNIILRNRHHEPLLENCIRISIGNKTQIEKVLNLLQQFAMNESEKK